MPRIIEYIADDFGLSPACNAAIILAHTEGVLTGASLMLGQPATSEAVALAKQHPDLRIGWHIHLCDSIPETLPLWPWGSSPAAAGLRIALSAKARQLARREIEAQWSAFKRTGFRCDFVNSHHHLHLHPVVLRTIRDVLGPCAHGAWLRSFDYRFVGRPPWAARLTGMAAAAMAPWLRRLWNSDVGTSVWGVDRTFRMEASLLRHAHQGLGSGRHEFLFHPRYPSESDPDTRALLALRRFRNKPERARLD